VESELSAGVRQLLDDGVDSIEQLELLLLLHRTRPRAWSVGAAASELRTNDASTRERLEELVTRRFAQPRADGAYAFTQDGATERRVGALADAYAERRVSVITYIVTKPLGRIRSFADAFRLRRDPDA
jgi:hypothetical protein